MKRYGNPRLKTAEVQSTEFTSPQSFNKLVVNNLSEVDQESLDHDVIIFNKDDDQIYVYLPEYSEWRPIKDKHLHPHLYSSSFPDLVIDDVMDVYNSVNFNRVTSNFLSVEPDLFDFGPIGSPVNFVIDFWITSYFKSKIEAGFGTILYNGLNTGQVDLEVNKNLLITTSCVELIKNPNYQDDPIRDFSTYDDTDNYVHVMRPALISKRPLPIVKDAITHVALIRSGDTTYLAINGKIEDSAPSVEYFNYDDVLIGAGYEDAINAGIINLRVSKDTDLGWTTDFIPPNFNPPVDANTDFLMGDATLTDTAGNYAIVVNGDAPSITQNRFFYQLESTDVDKCIKTNLAQDKLVLRLPDTDLNYSFEVDCDIPLEILTMQESHWSNIPHRFNRNTILDFTPGDFTSFTVDAFEYEDARIILNHRHFRLPMYFPYFQFDVRPLNFGGTIQHLWMESDGELFNVWNNIRNPINFAGIVEHSLMDGCPISMDMSVAGYKFGADLTGWDNNLLFDFIIELQSFPDVDTHLFGHNDSLAYYPQLLVDPEGNVKYQQYNYNGTTTGGGRNPIFKMVVGEPYHIILGRSRSNDSTYVLYKRMDADHYTVAVVHNPSTSSYHNFYVTIGQGPWYVSHVRSHYQYGDAYINNTEDNLFRDFRYDLGVTHVQYVNQHMVMKWYDYTRFSELKRTPYVDGGEFIFAASTVAERDTSRIIPPNYTYDRTPQCSITSDVDGSDFYAIDGDLFPSGFGSIMDAASSDYFAMNSGGYSWAIDFLIKLKPTHNNNVWLFHNEVSQNYNNLYVESGGRFRWYYPGGTYYPFTMVKDAWYHIILGFDTNFGPTLFWKAMTDDSYSNQPYANTNQAYSYFRVQYRAAHWYLSNLRFWRKVGGLTDPTFEFLKYPKGINQARRINSSLGRINETIW